MLTVEDLKNPNRKSGFDHVGSAGGVGTGHGGGKPWRFSIQKGTGAGCRTSGPRRDTPEEAAQDYCDYVNGQNITVAALNYPGHAVRDSQEKSEEEIAALQVLKDIKAQKENKQGYVYCIAEKNNPNVAVKIGYSTKPEARAGELQAGNSRELVVLGYIEGTLKTEKELQTKYIKHNLVGEWFTPTPQLLKEFGI